jgi:hypothetical protein
MSETGRYTPKPVHRRVDQMRVAGVTSPTISALLRPGSRESLSGNREQGAAGCGEWWATRLDAARCRAEQDGCAVWYAAKTIEQVLFPSCRDRIRPPQHFNRMGIGSENLHTTAGSERRYDGLIRCSAQPVASVGKSSGNAVETQSNIETAQRPAQCSPEPVRPTGTQPHGHWTIPGQPGYGCVEAG